jgi:hypothetical protein
VLAMDREVQMAKKKRKIRDGTDRLLTAVGAYVASKGGTAVVAGPISVMRWPGDRKLKYSIVIDCVGREPGSTGEKP